MHHLVHNKGGCTEWRARWKWGIFIKVCVGTISRSPPQHRNSMPSGQKCWVLSQRLWTPGRTSECRTQVLTWGWAKCFHSDGLVRTHLLGQCLAQQARFVLLLLYLPWYMCDFSQGKKKALECLCSKGGLSALSIKVPEINGMVLPWTY